MASIKCTNCGATLKTPTAVPAGKKVKCPKCGKPFVVEDEEEEEEPEETETDSDADEQEEEAPAPKKPVKKPVKVQDEEEEDSEEEESEEEEAPKKSPAKKPGKSKTGDAPKGGSKMLLIIVGVTLTLCCLGCGTVGYLFQATIKGIIGLGDAVSKDLKKINEELTKDKNKPADKTKIDKTEVAPPAILKADFVLSAIEFTDEFEANENAAEKKFTGKVVELTGDVSEVVFFGAQKKLGITLNPPGWTINIPIHPSAHAKVYRLSKGQSVKVVAAYKGSFGRILSLDESTLTEKAPSQIVEVTSENLAAAYEKLDFGKYDQKTLLVTGPVLERGKAKDGPEFAQLKGGKKLVVQVNGNTLGSLEVDKLAKGSTAVLRVNHARLDEANNRLILSGIVVIESK